MNLNTLVGLGVREKAPFTLAVKLNTPEAVPGIAPTVTITATRDKGFTEEIAINPPTNLPPNAGVPKIPNIAKDKNEVSFPLDLNAKVPMGEYAVLFSAKAKRKDGDVSAAAPPLDLKLGDPFDLKVEPAMLTLKPGDKAKLTVTATRRGGYKGPIAIEARKLAANVTGAKATIAADKTAVELEITADAKAPPADKTDVDVLGTATALNNLTNASPVFTVHSEEITLGERQEQTYPGERRGVSPTCFAAFTSGLRLDARQGRLNVAARLIDGLRRIMRIPSGPGLMGFSQQPF